MSGSKWVTLHFFPQYLGEFIKFFNTICAKLFRKDRVFEKKNRKKNAKNFYKCPESLHILNYLSIDLTDTRNVSICMQQLCKIFSSKCKKLIIFLNRPTLFISRKVVHQKQVILLYFEEICYKTANGFKEQIPRELCSKSFS